MPAQLLSSFLRTRQQPAVEHITSWHTACLAAGVPSATFSNVIVGVEDGFPNHAIDLPSLLRPPHIAGSNTKVSFTNVMLLHTVSASQAAVAVATLRGVVSDPIVQREIATWSLTLYTVSILPVPSGSYVESVLTESWNSCPAKQGSGFAASSAPAKMLVPSSSSSDGHSNTS
jgi:hypothetical protein